MVRKQLGVSLVELIIAIIIIGISATALLQSLGFQVVSNVDPMLRSQSQLLARQFLSEVTSKSYFDPSSDPRTNPTLSNAAASASLQDQTASTAGQPRSNWDNVYEYHGYDSGSGGIEDVQGNSISGLENYRVAVHIDISDALQLGGVQNSSGCPAKVMQIEVTTTDPRGQTTTLNGYRTSYWEADSPC
ncbi:prepilin-type N-terminal cleavage/methylation domain-containing protein [Saccharospirillum salsuginis]|uniref:MSHA pilin protein MshD n=1 Tax=Saccharospirillum salsuginis TaxID=418750 RepID=A0A918N7V4_9GAMM|nr:prepilin-type N-terminal cleavage/methylation domain-containing protein [Saccharospirillum salsuginis]GGX45613.1 hypothetical protein GCM10007392_10810 [Saccharospirillum salsuginis]